MFGKAASRYDRINRVTSLGRDRCWRLRSLEELHLKAGDVLLDLCCGTGDLALLAAEGGVISRGLDFAAPMLNEASKKSSMDRARVAWVCGDAGKIPFKDSCFSAAACAFGLRNTSEPREVLRECARVLKPGGRIAILEFFPIQGKIWGPLFRFYFHRILPKWAVLLGADASAYRYLPESVDSFPSHAVVAGWMEESGFVGIKGKAFAGGVARVLSGSLREDS